MRTKPCKACGKEINDKAEACPHCGEPLRRKKSGVGCFGTLVGLAILVLFLVWLSSLSGNSPTATVSTAPPPKPKPSVDHPRPTSGKYWHQIGTQGVMHYVVLKRWRNKDNYRIVVADLCGLDAICRVYFWHRDRDAALRIPFTNRQMRSMVGTYQVNRDTGFQKFEVACKVKKEPGCWRHGFGS